MDFAPLKYMLIALGGVVCACGLLTQYAVSALTQEKALHGSKNEKRVAFGIRIMLAILFYVVVIVVGRLFKSSTEQTAADALVLIFSCVAMLFYGGKKVKRWKNGLAGSRR